MGVEIAVPLGAFLMIFGIVASVVYFRYRTRQEMQLTVRSIIDSGQSLSTEMLEELGAALQTKQNDLRRGVICVALGIAVLFFAMMVGDKDAIGPLVGISSFPFFIGLGYLFLWRRDQANKAS